MRRWATVGLAAAIAFGCSNARKQDKPAAPPAGPLVISKLPRLRQQWVAPDLALASWPYSEDARVFDGVVVGWTRGGTPPALVAIEVATGKERWRIPPPAAFESGLEFAKGLVLVNGTGEQTTALDIKTGKVRWTAPLCWFYDTVRDNGTTAFVRCRGPDKAERVERGVIQSWKRTVSLIGFDLTDGRILWRRDSTSTLGGGLLSGNVAIGTKLIHLALRDTILSLDPRTGTEQRSTKLPAKGGWMVLAIEPGGRDVAILVPSGSGEMKAIRVSDGQDLWTRLNQPWQTSAGFDAALEQGQIVQLRDQQVEVSSLETGQLTSTCRLPEVATPPGTSFPRRWHLMRGNVVVVLEPHLSPPIVVRCGPDGASPAVPPTPGAGPVEQWKMLTAHDGTIIFRAGNQLVGYGVFDTTGAERESLSSRDRITAILNRALPSDNYTAGAVKHNGPLFEELRTIPNYAQELLTLARDAHFPQRNRAVDAVTALRIPGAVPLLFDEIFQPLPAPPPFSVQEAFKRRSQMNVDMTHYNHRQALWRRADQVLLLAEMNDAKAAARLGPLLLARSTPEGLGWEHENIWGSPSLTGFGRRAWDNQSDLERLVHLESSSFEGGFSETLPASSGRPEMHAAIYRLLARLGRPEDLALLDQFDHQTARPGGWAAICDADDTITTKDPEIVRTWTRPWGICDGLAVNIGGNSLRLTQARDVAWLRKRQRQHDGTFGPPAWADDQGGDQCLNRHTLQAVKVRGKRIAMEFNTDRSFQGAVDPAPAFPDADRDGLPDLTEAAFGTDPKRPDTDGDGIPDGRDPTPMAGPNADARAQAVAEMLRYATRFWVGGPLVFKGDRALWSDAVDTTGVLLHMPPDTDIDDETCKLNDPPRAEGAPKQRRVPFPVIRVESLEVAGDKASGRIVWSVWGERPIHRLALRMVGGKWRVVEDKSEHPRKD